MAVKPLGVNSWVRISRVEPTPVDPVHSPDQQRNPDSTYTCEPVKDLKSLFKKKRTQTAG